MIKGNYFVSRLITLEMFLALTHEQLRQLCRTSGVQVSIEPTNIRDTLYRASVNFVLNVCSRCDIINPAFLSIPLFTTNQDLLYFMKFVGCHSVSIQGTNLL